MTNHASTDAAVAVATSGGRDSIALLHVTLQAAAALGLRVVALHVHHGLQPQADDWLAGVNSLCERWAADGRPVAFASARVQGRPAKGESVENWARRERYAALARMAREAGATLVLLAHHRRDQAETVLLQALRGAGPAGLAAMPRQVVREGLTWARPWLDRPVEDIDAYVRLHALPFVRDPSNDDERWSRSRLRARVMPMLREAFPDAEQSLAAAARRAHEAREVLDEAARSDLDGVGDDAGLALAGWRNLSAARRRNALRAWLAPHAMAGVPETLLARLAEELADDTPRRWPLDSTCALRSWRGRLTIVTARQGGVPGVERQAGRGPVDEGELHRIVARSASQERETGAQGARAVQDAGSEDAAAPTSQLRLLRCGRHDVPGWAGKLEVFAVDAHGVSPISLACVQARARAGGEQFRREPRASDRSLKKQYQAAGVPPDARHGPLIFDLQDTLLFVPGLGVDARAWAPPGAPQWSMRWLPADDLSAASPDNPP